MTTVTAPAPAPAPTSAFRPADSADLDARKAQYAAWRDRLRHRDAESEPTVVDAEADARRSRWSAESLFDDSWSLAD